MGSAYVVGAIDNVSLPFVLGDWEVEVFDAPHAGDPVIGGLATFCEEVGEGAKGSVKRVEVGLLSQEKIPEGGDGVVEQGKA